MSQATILAAVNKKSDWTMDMPKIEYQPEQEEEDGASSADLQNLEQLDDNEFLSEESGAEDATQ